jgi:flagellar assembly protein FliH
MLCKISGWPDRAKPVAWPQVRGGSKSLPGGFSLVEVPSAEAAELRERIAELERSCKSEVAEARQTAFQEGLRQGHDESAAAVKASSERVAQMIAELASWKRKVRNEAEMELLKLSLSIARRILHRELLTDTEAIHGLVHAALQKIQNREIWRVRVYPAGADAVRSCLEQIGVRPNIEIVSDAGLKSGDLLIDTAIGELDASVDTQLQEIQRGFADRISLR